MDNCEWVIDTYVLYQAADYILTAQHFLTSISLKPQHKVAVDLGRCILRQYEKCFKRTKNKNEFPQKWWRRIKDTSNKLTFRHGKVSNRCNKHLQDLCCHNDDFPFIGVASRTKDKLLVTEDSDYTSEIRKYLKKELLVQVMSIEEADNHASQ